VRQRRHPQRHEGGEREVQRNQLRGRTGAGEKRGLSRGGTQASGRHTCGNGLVLCKSWMDWIHLVISLGFLSACSMHLTWGSPAHKYEMKLGSDTTRWERG
jgi:hypothetical protein